MPRYFVLREDDKETSVFKGKAPRQAALKAATRGHKHIEIRERGTKKVHVYDGSYETIPSPPGGPDWMGPTVRKPNVKKIRMYRLK